MKVLWLWNTAGVFTPVAEMMIDNGHEAKIVARYEFDIYKHTQNSRAGVMVDSATDFYKKGISLIRKWKPDIIHVSGSIKMLIFARAFAPRGIIVFSYHGSDVRNPTGKPHPEVALADFVHVTTPDLKPYGTWIDRPLSPVFHYRGGRMTRTALMFYKSHFYADKRGMAREWCNERGIKLTIIDESHPEFPIPNDQMPAIFSKFVYYLDFKDQKGELYALSKTALEALACGCNVVHDSDIDTIITTDNYKLARVDDYLELYESMEKASYWKAIKRYPRVLKGLIDWARGRAGHYG